MNQTKDYINGYRAGYNVKKRTETLSKLTIEDVMAQVIMDTSKEFDGIKYTSIDVEYVLHMSDVIHELAKEIDPDYELHFRSCEIPRALAKCAMEARIFTKKQLRELLGEEQNG